MGTFDWDVAHDRFAWSRWHDELWGFQPREFDGTFEALARRVHRHDQRNLQAELTRCIAAREPFSREFRVVWSDRTVHWIAARGEFSFDANGRPVRMRGAMMETTAHKRAEARLRASEASLEAAQALAHLGSWEFDLTTMRGTYSMEMFRLMYRDPALGVPPPAEFVELVHPEDRAAIKRAIAGPLEALEARTFEYRTHPSLGPIRHILSDPITLPWQSEARRRGFRSSAAFPIRVQGEVSGTLTVYAAETGFFRDKEKALLEEATTDISFGLDNLAHEEERRRAEAVARNERRFTSSSRTS